ncbi:hypothetical protein MUK42_07506 [Musa troglodytarum]|uniref:plastoquinol--plastocyanin reductase n=1 Tax=Musa troglodytarum TaxID=320322 RepID=A0A9E7IBM4_9LILI|nr:hypothetical protein MUK42_07506 [Musa troglodytarum]
MASTTTLSTAATPSQLCASKNGMSSPSGALLRKPVRGLPGPGKERSRTITCQATSIPADRVPDMGKRQLLNLLLLGAVSLPTAGMLIPYASFFVPAGSGAAGGGIIAKDALGNDVIEAAWLKTHGPGDRTLTQGLKNEFSMKTLMLDHPVFGSCRLFHLLFGSLRSHQLVLVDSVLVAGKGDPTYLVVENDRTLATYGINAVCTHLGCVVPWNTAEKKFICPCHGSQYNNQGKVVRGPAPLVSLHSAVSLCLNCHCLLHWPWLMLTSMTERLCLCRGWRQTSEQGKRHGGLKPSPLPFMFICNSNANLSMGNPYIHLLYHIQTIWGHKDSKESHYRRQLLNALENSCRKSQQLHCSHIIVNTPEKLTKWSESTLFRKLFFDQVKSSKLQQLKENNVMNPPREPLHKRLKEDVLVCGFLRSHQSSEYFAELSMVALDLCKVTLTRLASTKLQSAPKIKEDSYIGSCDSPQESADRTLPLSEGIDSHVLGGTHGSSTLRVRSSEEKFGSISIRYTGRGDSADLRASGAGFFPLSDDETRDLSQISKQAISRDGNLDPGRPSYSRPHLISGLFVLVPFRTITRDGSPVKTASRNARTKTGASLLHGGERRLSGVEQVISGPSRWFSTHGSGAAVSSRRCGSGRGSGEARDGQEYDLTR